MGGTGACHLMRREWMDEIKILGVLLFNVRKAEEALAAVERYMDNLADQAEATNSE